MRLRSNLLLLVAGTMLPVLGLTAALAYLLVRHEEQTFRQGAMDRNRTFMTAVDTELRGHITSLEALAASRNLEKGDLRTFHDDALRVLRSQRDWRNVLLFDQSARTLVNLRFEPGVALPPPVEGDTVRHAAATMRPVFGDLSPGPVENAYAIPVRVPVRVKGGQVYVVSAIVRVDRFSAIMREQNFPRGWAAGLIDAQGIFVARIPTKPGGQRVSADLAAALRQSKEGWFRGATLEGVDTFTAHLTSDVTRWTVAVAIPASQVLAVGYRAAWTIALGALACLALAIGFAYWMSRRIATPIARLAAAARSLGTQPSAPLPPAGTVDELREVSSALATAVQGIEEREALREREREALKAADKAKDEFLAMLGHEMRNPLSAITAAAHLLRLAKPGEDIALQAHNIIDRQSRQMTRLIEDLLDVSRLTMGKVTLKREPIELGDFASRVARMWQQARQRPEDALRLQTAPVWVNADRARLEQVITNLLDNADKFSPRHSPVILRVGERPGEALIEVADEGEGIPPEFLGRIFDLFVQGPQSADRARGGMGLGLTLVKRLVELHGGSVHASSGGAGKGARFTVHLASVPAGAQDPGVSARPERRAESRRILVVEDNDDGRRMLQAMLQLEGHRVRPVANGAQALAAAASGWVEVAIVDIGLPDIDGYEVARRIRASGAPIRLIALTGYGQEQDQRRAYEAGFDLHLTKPVSPDFLQEALAVLTAKERALNAFGN